jgi:hypothetical protein
MGELYKHSAPREVRRGIEAGRWSMSDLCLIAATLPEFRPRESRRTKWMRV